MRALLILPLVVVAWSALSPAAVRADPVPSTVTVFCIRITDVREIAANTFQFEVEFLNWTDTGAEGAIIALSGPNPGGVSLTTGSIDPNGRPLITEDVNLDTFTTKPPDASDLEDIDGDGILDPLEDNGVVDSGFEDNANGRLDNDPMPGNLNPTNDWTVTKVANDAVKYEKLVAGTAISNLDLLAAADPRKLISGYNNGAGPTTIDGSGNVSPVEAIDDGSNVLDGFTFTVNNLDDGDIFQLNWFLLDSAGDPIGTATSGNQMGFGVLNLARADNGVMPPAIFAGNAGFEQNSRDFFDSTYVVPGGAEFGVEFGPGLTAEFVDPAANQIGAKVNARVLGVSGIAEELPDAAANDAPLQTADSSTISLTVLVAAIAGAVLVSSVTLGGVAWFTRRRWMR